MIKDIEKQVAGDVEYTQAELHTFDKKGNVILGTLVKYEDKELVNSCEGVYFSIDTFDLTDEEKIELGMEVENE